MAPGVPASLPVPAPPGPATAKPRATLSRVVCTEDAPPRRYRVVGHSRFDAPVYQRHEDPGEGRTQRWVCALKLWPSPASGEPEMHDAVGS